MLTVCQPRKPKRANDDGWEDPAPPPKKKAKKAKKKTKETEKEKKKMKKGEEEGGDEEEAEEEEEEEEEAEEEEEEEKGKETEKGGPRDVRKLCHVFLHYHLETTSWRTDFNDLAFYRDTTTGAEYLPSSKVVCRKDHEKSSRIRFGNVVSRLTLLTTIARAPRCPKSRRRNANLSLMAPTPNPPPPRQPQIPSSKCLQT